MSIKTAQELKMAQELSHAKKGLGFGLYSGASWGLNGVILGMALAMAPFTDSTSLYIAPLVGACFNDGFAGLWLFFYNLFTGRWKEYGRTLKTKPGRIVCLAALFGGPIGMSGYLLGINMAGASYALSITAAYPALASILAVIFLKEKISKRVWCGIILCVAGSFIVGYTPPDSSNYPHFYLGIGLATLAAFGWAMEGVLSTYGMDLVDPDISIGIREATSFTVYFVAILPLIAGTGFFFKTFSHQSILLLALAGFLGGSSYLCWYRSLNTIGVGRAMSLNITYALWAVFFGWLLTDLKLTPTLMLGAVVITLGTLLVSINPKELINIRNKE